MKYPNLFTSMNIGSVPIKNRAVMTAMCVGLANHDGSVSEPLAAYYEERAKGGAGLIITECTRINEGDAVSHSSMLSMSHDRYIAPLKDAVDRVHAYGTKLFVPSSFIQAGRMWSCSLRYGVLTRGWRGSFRGIGISF